MNSVNATDYCPQQYDTVILNHTEAAFSTVSPVQACREQSTIEWFIMCNICTKRGFRWTAIGQNCASGVGSCAPSRMSGSGLDMAPRHSLFGATRLGVGAARPKSGGGACGRVGRVISLPSDLSAAWVSAVPLAHLGSSLHVAPLHVELSAVKECFT